MWSALSRNRTPHNGPHEFRHFHPGNVFANELNCTVGGWLVTHPNTVSTWHRHEFGEQLTAAKMGEGGSFENWEYWTGSLDLTVRKWRDSGEDCIIRNFITCALHQMLLRWSRTRLMGHVARTGAMWSENLKRTTQKIQVYTGR